jgi:hypothetical protein
MCASKASRRNEIRETCACAAQDKADLAVTPEPDTEGEDAARDKSRESSSGNNTNPPSHYEAPFIHNVHDLLDAEAFCTSAAEHSDAIQKAYDALSCEHEALLGQAQAKDENNQWLLDLNKENTRHLGNYERVVEQLRVQLKQMAQVDAALRLMLEAHPLGRNSSLHVSFAEDASVKPAKLRRASSPQVLYTHRVLTTPSIARTSMAMIPSQTQPGYNAQKSPSILLLSEDPSEAQPMASSSSCSKPLPWKAEARGDPADIPGRSTVKHQEDSTRQSLHAINSDRSRQESASWEESPSESPLDFKGVQMKSTVMFAPMNPLFGQFTTDMEQSVDWTPSLEDWHAQKDFGGNVECVGSNPTNPLFGRKTFELTKTGTWLVPVWTRPRETALTNCIYLLQTLQSDSFQKLSTTQLKSFSSHVLSPSSA